MRDLVTVHGLVSYTRFLRFWSLRGHPVEMTKVHNLIVFGIKQLELSKGYDYKTEVFCIIFLSIFSEIICFTHDVFGYFLNAV